jgi:hypothetical protein
LKKVIMDERLGSHFETIFPTFKAES